MIDDAISTAELQWTVLDRPRAYVTKHLCTRLKHVRRTDVGSCCTYSTGQYYTKIKKVKVAHIRLPSVGFRS